MNTFNNIAFDVILLLSQSDIEPIARDDKSHISRIRLRPHKFRFFLLLITTDKIV